MGIIADLDMPPSVGPFVTLFFNDAKVAVFRCVDKRVCPSVLDRQTERQTDRQTETSFTYVFFFEHRWFG